MLRKAAQTTCRAERGEDILKLNGWYRGFCRIHRLAIRRLTGLQRKKYTPEKLEHVTRQYYGYLREMKLIHKFRPEFIINLDEIPTFVDSIRGFTLAFIGQKEVEGKYTNSDRMRYTVNAAVAGTGEKLPISCIFQWTKAKKQPPK